MWYVRPIYKHILIVDDGVLELKKSGFTAVKEIHDGKHACVIIIYKSENKKAI